MDTTKNDGLLEKMVLYVLCFQIFGHFGRIYVTFSGGGKCTFCKAFRKTCYHWQDTNMESTRKLISWKSVDW